MVEKLKHRFPLPDFKQGDTIQCLNKDWGLLPVIFSHFKHHCNSTSTYNRQCNCPTNGVVIVTDQGYTHCIYTGRLTPSSPWGTLAWKLIKRKHPELTPILDDET